MKQVLSVIGRAEQVRRTVQGNQDLIAGSRKLQSDLVGLRARQARLDQEIKDLKQWAKSLKQVN